MCGMQAPLDDDQVQATSIQYPAEIFGSFILTHASVNTCIEALGVWVFEQLTRLEADDRMTLTKSVARMFVQPPMAFTESYFGLMRKTLWSCCRPIVLACRSFFTAQEIEKIGKDCVCFKKACREKPEFGTCLEDSEKMYFQFKDEWLPTNGRFQRLTEFRGGLTSAFLNTATAEGNFLVIGWEKDDSRRALTDFSLVGILQCRQFQALKASAGSNWAC